MEDTTKTKQLKNKFQKLLTKNKIKFQKRVFESQISFYYDVGKYIVRISNHSMNYNQCKQGYINLKTEEQILGFIERIKKEQG